MKKLFVLMTLFAMLFLASCENVCDVKEDINMLKLERTTLEKTLNTRLSTLAKTRAEVHELREKLVELKMIDNGKTPIYLITFELKQSHFSLDIGKHIKDATNKMKFPIAVSKEYYDNVKVGQEIVDKFRMGSMIMNGSFGDWKIKVINKQLK